jgi:cell division protease FtsH
MKLCLKGDLPDKLPEKLGAGLAFGDIASALRRNSTPSEALKRLDNIAKKRVGEQAESALPSLEECVFYGPAQDWGLALAKDVAATRKGLDWSLVPRGAVFFGEPGTGKTMLAAIIAQACGLPIVQASVADLFASGAGYLDSVIKAQRAVFERAAAASPCVLFWDEIDALPNRATLSNRAREWWLPVVDDFLLSVSTAAKGTIILGATNHLRDVDAALLRPGRMERAIEVRPPATAEGLVSILRFHLRDDLKGADLLPLARLGTGATAAMAMEWVREARRKARNAGREMIADDLASVIAPPDDRSPTILKRDAYHESAHAVAALSLGLDAVKHISLIRKGDTAGRMAFGGANQFEVQGRDHIEKLITVLLSGRAAEAVFCGAFSCGAGGHPNSDLAMATRLSSAIHGSLGLAGSLVYVGSDDDIARLLVMDPAFRRQVERDLNRLSAVAEHLVLSHRIQIERVAEELIKSRHLTGDDVERLMGRRKELPARKRRGG